MRKKTVSIKDLQGMSIKEAEEFCDSKRPAAPTYPGLKPRLAKENSDNIKMVKEHLQNLEKYEEDKKAYNAAVEKNAPVNDEINEVFLEYLKEKSGLNTIPKQYRDKVYSYAYQQGHSSGYGEVSSYLIELVDIFN